MKVTTLGIVSNKRVETFSLTQTSIRLINFYFLLKVSIFKEVMRAHVTAARKRTVQEIKTHNRWEKQNCGA